MIKDSKIVVGCKNEKKNNKKKLCVMNLSKILNEKQNNTV